MVTAHPSPRGGDGRLRALLDAHRSVTSDLELHPMLDRIVRAGTDLVDAGYGDLSLLEADEVLTQYVIHGIGPETDECLRVPIEVRGRTVGVLRLADPSTGTFSAADLELVDAFAATAGSALESARLHADAQQSRDWLTASGDITRSLLGGVEGDLLDEVVTRALAVAGADTAAIMVPTDAETRIAVVVTAGLGADAFRGASYDAQNSDMGRAVVAGEGMLLPDLLDAAAPGFPNPITWGPTILAPIADARGNQGALLLCRTRGRTPFDRRDADLATTFATQVSLAIELSEARADAESLRVLGERHRIAKDLHDNVMQRLFAIGVGLQNLPVDAMTDGTALRLRRHISDLDDTIDTIRERVFGLRSEDEGPINTGRNRFPRTRAMR